MARPPKTQEKVEDIKTEELVEVATTPETPKVGTKLALSNVKISDKEYLLVKVFFDFDTNEVVKVEKIMYNNMHEAQNAFKLESFKERFV